MKELERAFAGQPAARRGRRLHPQRRRRRDRPDRRAGRLVRLVPALGHRGRPARGHSRLLLPRGRVHGAPRRLPHRRRLLRAVLLHAVGDRRHDAARRRRLGDPLLPARAVRPPQAAGQRRRRLPPHALPPGPQRAVALLAPVPARDGDPAHARLPRVRPRRVRLPARAEGVGRGRPRRLAPARDRRGRTATRSRARSSASVERNRAQMHVALLWAQLRRRLTGRHRAAA